LKVKASSRHSWHDSWRRVEYLHLSVGLKVFTAAPLLRAGHVYTAGTAVAQWLRCCATNPKVAGSIPGCVSGFFIHIKSFRSTQPPNRNEYQEHFLGVNGRRVRLTIYHHPVPLSRNLGTLTSWNPLGPFKPVMGLLYLVQCTLLDIRIQQDNCLSTLSGLWKSDQGQFAVRELVIAGFDVHVTVHRYKFL